jgi:hypothetical protein
VHHHTLYVCQQCCRRVRVVTANTCNGERAAVLSSDGRRLQVGRQERAAQHGAAGQGRGRWALLRPRPSPLALGQAALQARRAQAGPGQVS